MLIISIIPCAPGLSGSRSFLADLVRFDQLAPVSAAVSGGKWDKISYLDHFVPFL